MNQLSKKEYKYRYKIIYENHFKKDKQIFLDKYVKRRLLTYKTFYLNYDFLDNMLAQYNLSKFSRCCTKVASSAISAANSIQLFAASLRQLGDYEKCKHLERVLEDK